MPDLLIDLRKLFIEIRFFCQQGFAWNAASIQNLFCIVIFCFSRFKSGEGSFCCQRVKELLVFFLADVQNRALLGKLCDLILCLLQAGGQIICRGDIVLLQELQTRFVNISLHDLFSQVRRHTWWILPFFNSTEQIAVVIIQRKESRVLWMWAIWLRLWLRREGRFPSGFDLLQIAQNGLLDTFF